MAVDIHMYNTIEALVSGLLFTFIFAHHSRWTVPMYAKKFQRRTNFPLLLHISTGVFELARLHYYRTRQGGIVRSPNTIDLAACFVQALTSLQLAKSSRRGDVYSTRPCYQAGSVLRVVLEVTAFIQGSAALHAASVKCLNSFIYTRLIIFVATRVLRLDSRLPLSALYAYGVFLGAVFAVNGSGIPLGVPVYITLVGVVMALNRLTSDAINT
jgi:hypothetical protein